VIPHDDPTARARKKVEDTLAELHKVAQQGPHDPLTRNVLLACTAALAGAWVSTLPTWRGPGQKR
jgi:hypothetical protein